MTGRKTLRCDCGHDATAADEWALVDAVCAHARDAHGIDLSVELALALVCGSGLGSGAGGVSPRRAHADMGRLIDEGGMP